VSSSRTGIPLSVKLMLTTSIVVAAAVAISAWYGQRTIAELARENVAARRTTGEAAIVRESELLARNVATAAAIPMAQQAYGEVKPLITATLRDYPRIQWIAMASDGKLVAATDGRADGGVRRSDRRPRGDRSPPGGARQARLDLRLGHPAG
jgi:hypothetical protein